MRHSADIWKPFRRSSSNGVLEKGGRLFVTIGRQAYSTGVLCDKSALHRPETRYVDDSKSISTDTLLG